MKRLLAFALVSVIATGCYTGRSPGAKHANYAINGALALVGAALLVAASNDDGSCATDDASCVGGAMGAGGGAILGALLVGGGVLGVGISAIVPTREPEP